MSTPTEGPSPTYPSGLRLEGRKVVVVGASCVDSTRILLNSKSDRHPNGIGNGSDVIGRYLCEQIRLNAVGWMPVLAGGPTRNDRGISGEHIYLPRFKGGGTIDTLRTHPKVRLIPTIVFGAYHPDLVHVGVQDHVTLNGLISGPMGHSHSAVTLYAYLAGFSQAQALRLFAEPVFERLGYYNLWDESVAYLRGLGVQAGYDLDTHLTRWVRRG